MELTEEQKIKIIESDHHLGCIKFNINTLTFECRGLWKRGQRFFLFPMMGPSSHFSEIEITNVNQAEYEILQIGGSCEKNITIEDKKLGRMKRVILRYI